MNNMLTSRRLCSEVRCFASPVSLYNELGDVVNVGITVFEMKLLANYL